MGNVGNYPDLTCDSDSFTFEKSDVGDGEWIDAWINTGESFEPWLSTAAEQAGIPVEYSLKQNFPNPFNPSTVISYQLAALSHVNLSVYDIAGRRVAELVNGWREAGQHEVTFDASNLASGMYFYQIQAGDYSAVRKMVLVK